MTRSLTKAQSDLVQAWFGDRFSELHPRLQALHIQGGQLTGQVSLAFGRGVAGVIGRRLARKMGLPSAGDHHLRVTIFHDEHCLHWYRQFNQQETVESRFKPVGTLHQGYWLETTGPLTMRLTVDILNGAWHWRCLNVTLYGCPIPLWLIPKMEAYKTVEDGRYRFHVSFSYPWLGVVFGPELGPLVVYEGLLDLEE
ncbi:MAG: DUF4166 domain-containing protein [Pseudomonadota bacterium]|nr:DUF4166 domain-containing protein [Pseudomonadota bacterium]